MPMTILEAMSYGLPVIATNVGGIPEVVEDKVSGFLINPGDYSSLAEKIELLAKEHDLRKKMGQQGYRIVREKFDIDVITKKLNNFYDELLA